jgi:hypothetical protein
MANEGIGDLTTEQVLERFGQPVLLKGGDLYRTRNGKDGLVLVLRTTQPAPQVTQDFELPAADRPLSADHQVLVGLAKQILRQLEPTFEDQILATLRRIETALTEKP